MGKLRLVRKTKTHKPEVNQDVNDEKVVYCTLPDCKDEIKLPATLPMVLPYGNIKVGICDHAAWICDSCRESGMLREVRKIANEHMLEAHLIRDFFPNI